MDDYYDHLGIEPDSGFEEAKSAYFTKSKQAFEQSDKEQGLYDFFLVHQAWAFVVGKTTGLFYSHKREDYAQLKISEIGDWENKFPDREDDIYEDAKVFYASGWEAFHKSEFYRDTQELESAPTVNFVPFILLNFVTPTVCALLMGWQALFFAMPIVYITLPRWRNTFRYMFFMPLSMTLQGVAYLLNQNVFWSIAFTITNLFLFLFSTSYTFIPFDILMYMFAAAFVLGLIIQPIKIPFLKRYTGTMLGLGLFPFMLHLFFAINFHLSSPLTVETHEIEFRVSDTSYASHGENFELSPIIGLKYGDYEEFLHIRHFPFREIIEKKHTIRMNIHEGLFGIPVLKSWTLE